MTRWLAILAMVGCEPADGGGSGDEPVPLTLTVTPDVATVARGESTTLTVTADALHDEAPRPIWRATGGRLDVAPDGLSAAWTAPWQPGTYTVGVQHPQQQGVSGAATLDVSGPSAPAYEEFFPVEVPLEAPFAVETGPCGFVAFYGDRIVRWSSIHAEPNGSIATDTPGTCAGWPNATSEVGAYGKAGQGAVIQGDFTPQLEIGGGDPQAVAVHPGGWLVASAEGPVVTISRTDDGQPWTTWTAPADVETLAWRPFGGGHLAIGAGDAVHLLDLETGTATEIPLGSAEIRWDAEGWALVGVGADGVAATYDAMSRQVHEWPATPEDPVVSAATEWWLEGDVVLAHASGRLRRLTPDDVEDWAVDTTYGEVVLTPLPSEYTVMVLWTAEGPLRLFTNDGSVYP